MNPREKPAKPAPESLTVVYDTTWMRTMRPGTNVVHIIPIHDLRPHRAGIDCECQPQRVVPPFGGKSHIVLLHQAWDAREYLSCECAADVEDVVAETFDEGTGEDD